MVTTTTFRRGGQVSESEFQNPDGSVAREMRLFDADGRIVEERFWTGDGPSSLVVYSYDALGRLAAKANVAADGTRRRAERYEYDLAGRRTKMTFLAGAAGRAGGDEVCVHYAIEGSEQAHSVPGAVTLNVAYDDRQLPAEASFHDAGGEPLRRIVFSRDHDGRLLTETVLFPGESPFPELQLDAGKVPPEERARVAATLKAAFVDHVLNSTDYRYHANGRLLEQTMRMGTLSEERTTYKYGDHELPVAQTSRSRSHSVDIDDDGSVRTSDDTAALQHHEFAYQFDAYGNWTERVCSHRVEFEPLFRRSNIERRTITYFEP
jgi:YD repeat-containing protein